VHVPATTEAVKVLRLFAHAPVILAPRLNLSPETLPELERLTKAFLEHTLEASLTLPVKLPTANYQLPNN
jgi:hypothetical protein